MKDENCLFCLIANGQIPSNTVYEDEDFRVILDIAPAAKGHMLILPKEHFSSLFELPEEIAAKVLPLAKKLAEAVKEAVKADGVNIVQNNGVAAGQTVPHFHLHIIPRKDGDNAMPLWTPGESVPEEQAKLAEQINKLMK